MSILRLIVGHFRWPHETIASFAYTQVVQNMNQYVFDVQYFVISWRYDVTGTSVGLGSRPGIRVPVRITYSLVMCFFESPAQIIRLLLVVSVEFIVVVTKIRETSEVIQQSTRSH